MKTSVEMDSWLQQRQALNRYARSALSERGWRLLERYGRLMDGPNSGRYVSGLKVSEAVALVEALVRGDELKIHLMHRHQSGNYEHSALRLVNGRLVMRFPDREEQA
jgi:hypothetical protein